jgi:hypothetical protein
MKRLAILHLVGNALLLWLGYYWLGMGESDGLHLAYSAAVILLFTLGALWLHGTALVYFEDQQALAFKNLLPLFSLVLVICVIYAGLSLANSSFGHEAFVIGSYTTMKLRRPIAPSGVFKGFHAMIWLMRWMVVPVLALPLVNAVANSGWSGFRKSSFRTSRHPLYWFQCVALLSLAIVVPFKLFFWVPVVGSFPLEVISAAARIGAAYLLFVVSMLALESCTAANLSKH